MSYTPNKVAYNDSIKTFADKTNAVMDALSNTYDKTDANNRFTAKYVQDDEPNHLDLLHGDTWYNTLAKTFHIWNVVMDGGNGGWEDVGVTVLDGTVTTAKIANNAVTSTKVDGTSVYDATGTQSVVNTAIANVNSTHANDVAAINLTLSSHDTRITGNANDINDLKTSRDMYILAIENTLTLAINVELIKGSILTGVSENMVVESLLNTNDVIITNGVYDSTAKKVYLP